MGKPPLGAELGIELGPDLEDSKKPTHYHLRNGAPYFSTPVWIPLTNTVPRACFQRGIFTCSLRDRVVPHCKENPIYVVLFWEFRGLSPNFHIHVSASDLYIPMISPHISLQQNRLGRPILEIINLSQIYECRNWETEHYNSVLEITVSFLGIHNWEVDIYIGFSPALHLQCSIVIRFCYWYTVVVITKWAVS